MSKKNSSTSRNALRLLVQALLTDHDILDWGRCFTDEFIGPNTVRRNGYYESEALSHKLPFNSVVQYGKPRRLKASQIDPDCEPLPGDARSAAREDFDLLSGVSDSADTLVWPSKIIRKGQHEPDGADFEIPFIETLTFGRPV